MSDRDVIAEVFREHRDRIGTDRPDCLTVEWWARRALAALREARTVRTVEELDALPHLAVVREIAAPAPVSGLDYGSVWERQYGEAGWKYLSGTFTAPAHDSPRLPARVLYVPGDENAL